MISDKILITAFGFIGVILGAFLTTIKEVWLDRRSIKQKAIYLSIMVLSLFDKFVSGCVKVVNDDGTIMGQRNPDGTLEAQVEYPKLDFQSLDVEWKSLPSELL